MPDKEHITPSDSGGEGLRAAAEFAVAELSAFKGVEAALGSGPGVRDVNRVIAKLTVALAATPPTAATPTECVCLHIGPCVCHAAATPSAGDAESPTMLAVIGQKHFGNPIPPQWYAAAKELRAAPTRPQGAATLAADDAMVERARNTYVDRISTGEILDKIAGRGFANRMLRAALTAALNPPQGG